MDTLVFRGEGVLFDLDLIFLTSIIIDFIDVYNNAGLLHMVNKGILYDI